MEIAKNTTTLTKKMLSSFQNLEILKKSWLVALGALAVIILSFTIINGQIVLRSIPFLVIGCAIYPLYVIALKIIFSKQNKAFKTTTIDYIFTEDKILIYGQSGSQEEKTEIYYSQLEKFRQTKKYIFLYVNSASALVIDKKNFNSGSAEKLVELLKLRFSQKTLLKQK